MTNDSLIDLIRKEANQSPAGDDYERGCNAGMRRAIAIIRQHEAGMSCDDEGCPHYGKKHSHGKSSEILDNKCPDCGATMIEVCSGLEINAHGEASGLCRHSDYCEKPIKPVSGNGVEIPLGYGTAKLEAIIFVEPDGKRLEIRAREFYDVD